MERSYFKLSILGELKSTGTSTLTVQAVYRKAQQVESVQLRSKALAGLLRQIRELRGFITTSNPQWTARQLRDLGKKLFDLVIAEQVRDLLHVAIGDTGLGTILPLEITVQDYQVATWPWEFMYDRGRSQFICQEFNPICRSILNMNPGRTWPEKTDVARLLLLVGARPRDERTRPEEYIAQFRNRFETHLANGQVELTIRTDVDPARLVQELVAEPPDIVHFYGHAALDPARNEGYLSFERAGGAPPERYYANDFAQLLATHNVRLAFLNACETGVAAPDDVASRSSIAAALLSRGIPAVIATQYAMPVNSASVFSSLVYSMLSAGHGLLEAVKYGRNSLRWGGQTLFCDWGIPVLYASEPDLVFFPRSEVPAWAPPLAAALDGGDPIAALSRTPENAAPRISVEPSAVGEGHREGLKVALVDIDSNVGFLPQLAARANLAQTYFRFSVAYPPVPSITALAEVDGRMQLVTRLDRLNEPLRNLPATLAAQRVCCLTGHYISAPTPEEPYDDYFTSPLPSNNQVLVISTYGLRDYAETAGVTFEAAVLFLCLAQLVSDCERGLIFHKETAACLFDFCYDRDDIVAGLRHMRFDHLPCRRLIEDPLLLQAIDALLELARSRSPAQLTQPTDSFQGRAATAMDASQAELA